MGGQGEEGGEGRKGRRERGGGSKGRGRRGRREKGGRGKGGREGEGGGEGENGGEVGGGGGEGGGGECRGRGRGGGEGEGRLKSRNIKAFPAAELSHVRGLVFPLGEAAGPGPLKEFLKRGRLPGILGGARGGVQAESFVWRQVLKPVSPRRVAGRMGACGQPPGRWPRVRTTQ